MGSARRDGAASSGPILRRQCSGALPRARRRKCPCHARGRGSTGGEAPAASAGPADGPPAPPFPGRSSRRSGQPWSSACVRVNAGEALVVEAPLLRLALGHRQRVPGRRAFRRAGNRVRAGAALCCAAAVAAALCASVLVIVRAMASSSRRGPWRLDSRPRQSHCPDRRVKETSRFRSRTSRPMARGEVSTRRGRGHAPGKRKLDSDGERGSTGGRRRDPRVAPARSGSASALQWRVSA